MLAAANSQALWYLTRATGLVSLLLLTCSVVLGILGVQRWATPRWPRFVTGALHKNVSLLATAFVAVHVVAAVTDSFVTITWINALVPFTGTYRPLWLGLGAVAGDLLIALVITSLARPWIGYRVWRVVHWAAYACWPVALVHGLGTGTDPRQGWALAVFVGCLAVVCAAIWWRVGQGVRHRGVGAQVGLVSASAATPLLILVWLVAGPLQPGWAARSGTPASARPVSAPTGSSSSGFGAPFTATLSGTSSQTPPDAAGNATVTLAATLSGPVSGALRVTLAGPAATNGGVDLQSSQATLGPTKSPALFSGEVISLSGDRLVLVLRGATAQIYAAVNVAIDASGNLTGTITTSTAPPRRKKDTR